MPSNELCCSGPPPPRFALLGEVGQRLLDEAVVCQELAVVRSHADEGAQLCQGGWRLQRRDGRHLVEHRLHSISGHNVPQELDLDAAQLALRWSQLDPDRAEALQHSRHVLYVLLEGVRVDNYIVRKSHGVW